ncbi:MAG: hypothetical protein AB1696_20385 [Planctomycetota bacterium]
MAEEGAKLPPLPRDAEPTDGAVTGQLLGIARGLAGAAIGGALGYFAFGWLVRQGFYAMVLPGGLIGIGCGLASGRRSVFLGIVCAIATVALCFFLEWKTFPFIKDPSLPYFLRHVHLLRPMTWILIAVGAVIAFWLGAGRETERKRL